MKKALLFTVTLSLLMTVYTKAEWIDPEQGVCSKNGGKLTKKGGCKASWLDANKICHVAGGKLPTIDELKKVVIQCEGEIDAYENNLDNVSYQQCFKEKGFSDTKNYWSATTTFYDIYGAWSIDFKYGSQDDSYKNCFNDVKCIKVDD